MAFDRNNLKNGNFCATHHFLQKKTWCENRNGRNKKNLSVSVEPLRTYLKLFDLILILTARGFKELFYFKQK
jgi:hypothetical protein